MKKYLFSKNNIQVIVKAPNEFMAMCYANQYMEGRYLMRFETYEAMELDNDMDFGVIAVSTGGSMEWFTSEHKYWIKEHRAVAG